MILSANTIAKGICLIEGFQHLEKDNPTLVPWFEIAHSGYFPVVKRPTTYEVSEIMAKNGGKYPKIDSLTKIIKGDKIPFWSTMCEFWVITTDWYRNVHVLKDMGYKPYPELTAIPNHHEVHNGNTKITLLHRKVRNY